jgi:O-antigen ligase
VAFVSFGLGFLCVLYTFSRGGFITVILASATILIVRFRKKLSIAFGLLLLFTLVFIQNKDTFSRQVNLIVDPASAIMEPTILHRYITYQRHWFEFTQKPWFGSGWGSREYYWGRTLLYSFWEVRHERSIRPVTQFGGLNSLFLNSMVKGGMISLLALLLLILAVFRTSVKALSRHRGLIVGGFVASMAAFMAHQPIDNLLQWQQLSAVFWTNLGALIAISKLKKGPDEGPLEEWFLPKV